MNTHIALFRGINVGGKNSLPMKELARLLEEIGLREVRTYIQSGNVVFKSEEQDLPQLSARITEAVKRARGFEPWVHLLSREALERTIASNPFPEGESEPKSLHAFFLAAAPESPDLEKLETVKSESERFALVNQVFYLHAPDGIGRSKLAEKVERALGVPTTARNWRTVRKLSEMAG